MTRYFRLLTLVLPLLLLACSNDNEPARKLLGTASGCDAATNACEISAGEIRLSLALGPNVKPLVDFPVRLMIQGGEVAEQSVIVDFQMKGMDMGMNRYRLQSSSPSVWQGHATLPVCTASRMDWLAIVEFSLSGRPYQAVFPFHTESN